MTILQIMDVTKTCRYFPNPPTPEIPRDSFLDSLETYFRSNSIIIIDGADGIGKTTLCSQFCLRYPNNAISLFINPITRSSYDPNLIRIDLYNQINWILTKKEIEDPDKIDFVAKWGIKKWELQKLARNSRQTFYFVIDGLTQIDEKDSGVREQILDLIPFGESNEFKFLITDDKDVFSDHHLKKVSNKHFLMSGYTFDEACQSLSEMNISREEIKALYQVNKLPLFFASIRRILSAGTEVKAILEDIPKNCPEIFEYEWNNISNVNGEILDVLSLIAFSRIELTTTEISEILGIDIFKIKEKIQDISFIDFGSNECGIKFISESHRKFVCSKLASRKDDIETRIIEFIKTGKNNDRGLVYLPKLYEQSNRHSEIISFVTPENYVRLLEIDKSLITLQETASLAVNAAQSLNRDIDLFSFSVQSAIFKDLLKIDSWECEIEALLSIKDMDGAIELVERAVTKEDKFYLLAVLINAMRKMNYDLGGIEKKIYSIFDQIEIKKLGERAIDIAANIINTMPDLAFDLVEKAAESDDSENSLDWAFAKLSIKAYEKFGDEISSSDFVGKIKSKIKDPKVRKFSIESITYLDYSSTQIISEIEKIEKASEKLFLLRAWLKKNRELDDAYLVIEHALHIAISTTDYSPNARDFRELSAPLPYIKNKDIQKKLINIFDSQKGNIEILGPNEDYVRFLLTIARAEKNIDFEQCRNRLVDVYLFICYIDDISTKTSCLSRLLSTIDLIDNEKELERKDKLHSITEKEIRENQEKILKNSADQYKATKGIIRALTRTRAQKALEFAKELNSVESRDKAILDIVVAHLQSNEKEIQIDLLKECIKSLTINQYRDEAIIEIISRFSIYEDLQNLGENELLHFINLLFDMYDPFKRSNACCLALKIITLHKDINKEIWETKVCKCIEESWNQIDASWNRVNVGFKIVEALSEYPEKTKLFVEKIQEIRETFPLPSEVAAMSYVQCLSLTIRAFSGLFKNKNYTLYELDRIKQQIDYLPAKNVRIEFYTELSLRFYLNNRVEEFQDLVRSKIQYELNTIPEVEKFNFDQAILISSPALYLYHPISALSSINKLPMDIKDDALLEIAWFILSRRVRSDPYFDPGNTKGQKISYENITDVIEIMKNIDEDGKVFALIFDVAEIIHSHRNDYSRTQKSEIARQLEAIQKKFPNQRFIKHRGYIIVTQSQIYKILPVTIGKWLELDTEARKIDNIADQIFIRSYIAQSMPNNEIQKKRQIFEEINETIIKIPSIYDQITRSEIIANSIVEFDRQFAKRIARTGFELALNSDTSDSYSALRRFIDFAYKLDPELAASFASMADDDPARAKAKQVLDNRFEALKLKEKMISSKDGRLDWNKHDDELCPQTSWNLLGSLNAGRISSIQIDKTRDYTLVGSNLMLSQSYPIFSWIIQNSIVRYQDTPHALEYIRPVFEACLRGCDLISQIAQKTYFFNKHTISTNHEKPEDSLIFIDSETERVQNTLKNWIRENLKDYLYIADGYFGLNDLWILKFINEINPSCEVSILTSKEYQSKVEKPWEESYQNFWRQKFSDQHPPYTEIIIASLGDSGKSPIHDRWWITNDSGIRLGNSLSGLGLSRVSDISDFAGSELPSYKAMIMEYITRKKRDQNNQRISYVTFTLT